MLMTKFYFPFQFRISLGFVFACLHYEAGDYGAALTECEAYLEDNNSSVAGHQLLALISEATGHQATALVELERAFQHNIHPMNGQVKSWSKQQDIMTLATDICSAPGFDPVIRQTWLDRAQAQINPVAAAQVCYTCHFYVIQTYLNSIFLFCMQSSIKVILEDISAKLRLLSHSFESSLEGLMHETLIVRPASADDALSVASTVLMKVVRRQLQAEYGLSPCEYPTGARIVMKRTFEMGDYIRQIVSAFKIGKGGKECAAIDVKVS